MLLNIVNRLRTVDITMNATSIVHPIDLSLLADVVISPLPRKATNTYSPQEPPELK